MNLKRKKLVIIGFIILVLLFLTALIRVIIATG